MSQNLTPWTNDQLVNSPNLRIYISAYCLTEKDCFDVNYIMAIHNGTQFSWPEQLTCWLDNKKLDVDCKHIKR